MNPLLALRVDVSLSIHDPRAQDLLLEYARRLNSSDPEFSRDLHNQIWAARRAARPGMTDLTIPDPIANQSPSMPHDDGANIGVTEDLRAEDARGICRTRNNLRDAADQLEAAFGRFLKRGKFPDDLEVLAAAHSLIHKKG